MVREFQCPVNVSPLIRFGRWCMLFAGIGYGFRRHNALQCYEDERRALREQQKIQRQNVVVELKDVAAATVDKEDICAVVDPSPDTENDPSSDFARNNTDVEPSPTTSPDILNDSKFESQNSKTVKKAIIVIDRTPDGQKDIVVADPFTTIHRKDTTITNGSSSSAGRKDTADIKPSPIEHPYIWDDPIIIV